MAPRKTTTARKVAPSKGTRRPALKAVEAQSKPFEFNQQWWDSATVEDKLNAMAWCHVELVWATKMSFAKLVMMNNPQLQEQMLAKMIQEGSM